jgi:hypothetical protein
MKIGEFVKEYTSGRRFVFTDVLEECREFFVEVLKFNVAGIKDEAGDALLFLQIWFYWRFGLNGELWKMTNGSTEKIMNRISIWRQIYKFVGLPQSISNYAGNYARVEKVVLQLGRFGVDKARAKEAYSQIVLKQI